jgi:hypothetical protein
MAYCNGESNRHHQTKIRMTRYLPIVLRLYKWLALIFLVLYIVLIIYDDFVFIKKISSFSDLVIFIGLEFLYLFVYFLSFTFLYWILSVLIMAGLKLLKNE